MLCVTQTGVEDRLKRGMGMVYNAVPTLMSQIITVDTDGCVGQGEYSHDSKQRRSPDQVHGAELDDMKHPVNKA